MWHITSNPLVSKIFAVFLTGLVIKMMDDFIDSEYDDMLGKRNLSNVLGRGILPYAIFIFSLACLLDPRTSIGLFFSSYILGMVTDYNVKMPAGLYGYQESLIVLSLGILLLGFSEITSSLFIMGFVQLWDDLCDYKKEKNCGKNYVKLLGKVECIILSIICFLSAFYFDAVKTVAASLSAASIVYIIFLLSSCEEVS